MFSGEDFSVLLVKRYAEFMSKRVLAVLESFPPDWTVESQGQ